MYCVQKASLCHIWHVTTVASAVVNFSSVGHLHSGYRCMVGLYIAYSRPTYSILQLKQTAELNLVNHSADKLYRQWLCVWYYMKTTQL